MRSRLAMLASCAILACLAASLPSAAAAARTTAEFDLEATNGYTAYFRFFGDRASVGVIRLPNLLAVLSASYLSEGRREGDRMRARFGSRGRVAVEFKPTGKASRRHPPRRCEGKPRVTQPGVFAGTIRFRGEGGYTNVDATRVKGHVHVTPRWRCKRGKASRSARSSSAPGRVPLGLDPEAERFTVLDVQSDDGRVSFGASATRPRGRSGETLFTAARIESRPSLTIFRSAFAHGEDEAFTFDEALSTASAAPPPPFSGTAAFIRDAGGKVCVRYPCERSSWLGPLAVDFPGAKDVPLAGATFQARLYRSGPFGVKVGSGE